MGDPARKELSIGRALECTFSLPGAQDVKTNGVNHCGPGGGGIEVVGDQISARRPFPAQFRSNLGGNLQEIFVVPSDGIFPAGQHHDERLDLAMLG